MPPTNDIEGDVARILEPFNENSDENRRGAFFDWYVIGGRFAGNKMRAALGEDRIKAFYDWLKESNVTVSSFTAGKESLSPTSQIPMVDAKWSEMFPEAAGPCPLFAHSNDQYAKGTGSAMVGDVCTFDKVPPKYEAERVIICAPSFAAPSSWVGQSEAGFMLARDAWNGCNYMKIDWDGLLSTAIDQNAKRMANMSEGYRAKATPQPDWLVVTVDCHS